MRACIPKHEVWDQYISQYSLYSWHLLSLENSSNKKETKDKRREDFKEDEKMITEAEKWEKERKNFI